VINDATVSRHHAVLRQTGEGWTLAPVPGVKAVTRLGDLDLKAGQPALLHSRDKVRLGEAVFTYYDLPG